MIKCIYFFETETTDPYYNLAIEKQLLNRVEPGICILYLWQNKNTVVIGRNQNPWIECRNELLESEGGKLARRLSGGGAVFHDMGNLNFTFLLSEEDFDLNKQLRVIQTACSAFQINAEFSGRNDLLVDGMKFSGNAFFHSGNAAYHHGTLLVNADMEKLSRYLSPSKAKLKSKGVQSVRSRVTNLIDFAPNLTCDILKDALKTAFSEVYQLTSSPLLLSDSDNEQILTFAEEFASWEWLYGAPMPFDFTCNAHFNWGNIELQLSVKNGVVQKVKAFTDAMDWTLANIIEDKLSGVKFNTVSLCDAILRCDTLPVSVKKDICAMISAQNI